MTTEDEIRQNVRDSVDFHVTLNLIDLSLPPDVVLKKLLKTMGTSFALMHRVYFYEALSSLGSEGPAIAAAFANLYKEATLESVNKSSREKAQPPNLRSYISRH